MIRILFIIGVCNNYNKLLLEYYNTTIIGRLVDRKHVTYANSKSTR